jgi:polysaccharide pyruvyl transferase WcaK-like protein
MSMRCLLIGNYGVGNVGDEALKEYFLSRFPEVEWQVVSAAPTEGELPRLPAGVRSLVSMRWWRTLRALRKADAVVFGGGSLFTDVESLRACVIWGIHAWAAHLLGIPLLLAFQGIGPLRTPQGERWTRWVIRHATFLSVRDQASYERVFAMNSSCVRSSDPVFISLQNVSFDRSKNVILAIPRHNSDAVFRDAFTRLLKDHADPVRLLSLQPDDAQEREMLSVLQALDPGRIAIVPALTLQALADEVAQASHVLTQRYHGAIAAISLGAPVTICPQREGDKLWALKMALEKGNAALEVRESLARALEGEKALKEVLAALQRKRQRA